MTYPKRLIEVDLPIKRISAHARREKSIRHGHISTLHIWWARRPLAACRAVICAALWPDPADESCPPAFREAAGKTILDFARKVTNDTKLANDHCSPENFKAWSKLVASGGERDVPRPRERERVAAGRVRESGENQTYAGEGGRSTNFLWLRSALLDFIADFANWDNSTVREYLDTSRALTQAAHEALGGAPGTRPLVVDPFAGGGSIPLEALRVGADAFASDLNPVPVLLNKVVLEYIPKYGQRLANEVRKWGEWIKREAEKELAEFYPCLPAGRPRTPDEATPGKFYAYVLRCSDGSLYKGQTDNLVRRFKQHCNGEIEWTKAHVPVDLIHFEEFDTREQSVEREKWLKSGVGREWLASKFPKETPIAYLWARTIQCEGPGCGAEIPLVKSLWLGKKPHNSWSLRVVSNKKLRRVDFEVVQGAKPGEVGEGTVKRGSAVCPCCGFTTPTTSIRKQLTTRNGGTSTPRLFCVVTKRASEQGRFYRLPTDKDLEVVAKAAVALKRKEAECKLSFSLIPDEPLPPQGTLGFRVQLYGMKQWGHLFSPRQALVLVTLNEKTRQVREELAKLSDAGLGEAVQAALALNVDKMADYGSSLASWSSPASQETVRGTFSRQALAMVWDFAEAYPFVSSSGGWTHNLNFLISPLEAESRCRHSTGHIERASATKHPLPDDCVDAFVTDPPYYDAIPYADLSDYFIVWLKRSLDGSALAKNFATLSDKEDECVVDEVKGHDAAFFERTMAKALIEGRRVARPGGVGIVVFAHKSTAGWEAQLQAMIDAGWVMTGSWPIDTEREGRVRANSSAALASSVHLVCRPRLPVGRHGENPDGSVRLPDRQAGTDSIGDWRDVLQELPRRIHEWMPRLAEEGVVGADAIFACLGPALEIFSRYSRVEKASGEAVTLKEFLEQVWAAVAKEALTMIFTGADTTGFEEDARLTAMWLWTLNAGNADTTNGESAEDDDAEDEAEGGAKKPKTAGFVLEYDAARKIAQGLGAHLEDLTSLVEISGETARLLPVGERARHLFGKDEGKVTRAKKKKMPQLDLFKVLEQAEEGGTTFGETNVERHGDTVLDRIHQSMILFAAGRSEALKRFLVEDGAGRDQRFWRLAQALSALYPSRTEEKRWVDGVLARKKGLGF